ncbi:MAG: bifunctional phosphoribosyl-AMP cyclohydrolase/phosphoribosyl-ATP diphosphatase HisIE [Actinobacteria bacterium]|nr:bifunctional phosphoribosyl-AMP cyclohydrolase/phosphoribosyl-ATP diphosphatase HisIE [Actinomycetota bacterium]
MTADENLRFDADGLLPCVVQDRASGAVLTLAYMNAESLAKTRETGETWFYSRSRGELWHKGATSGNTQRVVELRYDCDADTLLAIVDPAGPACHTGADSCFYRSLGSSGAVADNEAGEAPARHGFEAPGELQATLDARRAEMPEGSYTTQLLNDPELIAEKVLEEAEEVTRAAREETDERVAEEAADVLYHLAVLMTQRGLALQDAFDVLNRRARPR